MNSEKYFSVLQNFLLLTIISKKPRTTPPIIRFTRFQVTITSQGKTKVKKPYVKPAATDKAMIVVAMFLGSENQPGVFILSIVVLIIFIFLFLNFNSVKYSLLTKCVV